MIRLAFLSAILLLLTSVAPALAQKARGPVEVIVAPVKKAQFSDEMEALGTTKANESVVITAETSKKVTDIHFEDGQEVKAGDLLLTLDKSQEDAELRSAEATLSERQSAYTRAKGLQETSALSKATLQERLAALKEAEADIESIKARIEKLAITAPFDGILGLREVSVGTLVQPGDMITTIDDLTSIKVDFDVPSIFLSTLKPGLPISGKVEAFGDREFKGEVQTINTQVDPVTRTVKIRAILPNPELMLKPGLLMSITLLQNPREALLIPEESLIKRGAQNFVYVAEETDGKIFARQREIKIGSRQPGVIEVLQGLTTGDKIVSHGILKISDGSEISIRAEEKNDEKLEDLLRQKEQALPKKAD